MGQAWWQETRELEMLQQELRKADSRGVSDDDMYPPVERMDTVAAVAGDDENFVLSDEEASGARAGEDHATHKPKSRKCGLGITFRRVSLRTRLIGLGSEVASSPASSPARWKASSSLIERHVPNHRLVYLPGRGQCLCLGVCLVGCM
jgi:hypothetical protein